METLKNASKLTPKIKHLIIKEAKLFKDMNNEAVSQVVKVPNIFLAIGNIVPEYLCFYEQIWR